MMTPEEMEREDRRLIYEVDQFGIFMKWLGLTILVFVVFFQLVIFFGNLLKH